MENANVSDSSCVIKRIIEEIKTKKKKPDKDFITREGAQQGPSQDTLVSLLFDTMVSAGSLYIKKGSCCNNKAKDSINDKQYSPEMPTVANTEHHTDSPEGGRGAPPPERRIYKTKLLWVSF